MFCSLLALLLGTFLAGALPSGVRAQTIHQWPPTKVQLMGSPFSLECTVKGRSSPNLYWYWQAEGRPPQMLFYSISTNQIDPEAYQNWKAFRPQDGHFILNSTKLLLNNSGIYLCAWSITLSWVRQTSVQKLHPPGVITTLSRSPPSGTEQRTFVTEFLTVSQCGSN